MAIYPKKKVVSAKFGFDMSKLDGLVNDNPGATDGISAAAGIAGELISKSGNRNMGYGVSRNSVGSVTAGTGLKGMAMGLQAGKSFGAPGLIIGGAVGLVGGAAAGFFNGKKMKEKAEHELTQRIGDSIDENSRRSRKRYGSLQGFTARSYAPGGKIGPSKSIILGGKLHKDGGNPIVFKEGMSKVAETEREELLLSYEHTREIDSLIEQYETKKLDSVLEKLGRRTQAILLNETIDNSGIYT